MSGRGTVAKTLTDVCKWLLRDLMVVMSYQVVIGMTMLVAFLFPRSVLLSCVCFFHL
jgi:hypothetical protein